MDSVKIMRSYDYCHFEITLGCNENPEVEDQSMRFVRVDEHRKKAQRLVDKAVNQYRIAREWENKMLSAKGGYEDLKQKVKVIKENFPKSEWTPEQKAAIKTLEQYEWNLNHPYDYQDYYDYDDD